jgi:hypothetical protein
MTRLPFYLSLLVAVAGSRCALAQPAQVTRLIRNIDFEERRLGNDEDVPMNWAKVEGPNLPHYLNGALSTDRVRSGKYAFRFDLSGGSLVYRYAAGQIPVTAGAHYRVDAAALTSVLPHARARVSLGFADHTGRVIPSTLRHSERYAASGDTDTWHALSVEATVDDAEAASLVIELELLQPVLYANTSGDELAVLPQDITGSAWFDDIKVWQVPRIQMLTDRPGNIFRRGQPLRVWTIIADRVTADLTAQLILKDSSGATAFQRSGALADAQTVAPDRKKSSVDLPSDLPPGWYQAVLVMSSGGVRVAEQAMSLVVLSDEGKTSALDPRLGVVATSVPSDEWNDLATILPLLGAGTVKIAAWPATSAEAPHATATTQSTESAAATAVLQNQFTQLVGRLQEGGVAPTVCLLAPPASLGIQSWKDLKSLKPERWQPLLSDLIARHGNHVPRWQLGADNSEAFASDPAMREACTLIHAHFANFLSQPPLVVSWPASAEIDPALPAQLALSIPASVLPAQVSTYVQELQQRKSPTTAPADSSLSLQLLDREQFGRDAQIRDLAQRVIHALAAGATHIDLPLPLTSPAYDDGTLEPTELFLPIRTLATTLGGATFKGVVPVAEGVQAMLFEKGGTGILAIWGRADASAVPRQLELDPGPRPRLVDLQGNSTPLLVSNESRASGKVRLSVGPMPIFIVDVDGPLAQFRASVAVDRPLIESTFQAHSRHLHFTNPYPHAISGSVRLRSPAGWTIIPAAMTFSLNPGETLDREFSIEFPYNSVSGTKSVDAQFTLQTDKPVTFTAPLMFKLGLSDVGMQSLAFREGADVIVQQTIANYSDKPIDYSAYALFPGRQRQERLVTKLGPGQTIIKRYRFDNAKLGEGTRVRVGLKELAGTRILNDDLVVH